MTKPKPLPEIAKCPCGGSAELISDRPKEFWMVVCHNCGRTAWTRRYPDTAIRAWNKLMRGKG